MSENTVTHDEAQLPSAYRDGETTVDRAEETAATAGTAGEPVEERGTEESTEPAGIETPDATAEATDEPITATAEEPAAETAEEPAAAETAEEP
ncbi:MAG TPA: hypothetical protein VFQ85_18475, partial [Mycobacteriales bacterium]|nr:hypothetical protein [Mycobacteriales bacterium]